MSCICKSPIRPEFKDSYKDLLDKPRINGTIINGDIETDNLGIKYPKLTDKPSINGVPLEGALTAEDLGIKAGAKFKIVTALPTTDIDPLTIYLVPADVSGESNFYQEFIYINNSWEKIGEPITMEEPAPPGSIPSGNLWYDLQAPGGNGLSVDLSRREGWAGYGSVPNDNTFYLVTKNSPSYPIYICNVDSSSGDIPVTIINGFSSETLFRINLGSDDHTSLAYLGRVYVKDGLVYMPDKIILDVWP